MNVDGPLDLIAYPLYAAWLAGDKDWVVDSLAGMARFDAVLIGVMVLDLLPKSSRAEFRNALEESAWEIPRGSGQGEAKVTDHPSPGRN